MTVNAKQKSQPSTGRLSASQKFWLFGVGGPVLLLAGLLALLVLLPRPLNPTEQKLLGRWEVVFPGIARGEVEEFARDYRYSTLSTQLAIWTADEGLLSITEINGSELWTRITRMVGFPKHEEVYEIERLTGEELDLRYSSAIVISLRRIHGPGTVNPQLATEVSTPGNQ